MMEFLRFTFESPLHFFGVLLLIVVTGELLVGIAQSIRGKE